MNLIIKKTVQFFGTKFLKKAKEKVDGQKTYILAVGGILVAFIGVYWGPIDVLPGPQEFIIPAIDWDQFWKIVWGSWALIAGRSAYQKMINKSKK